MLTSLRVDTSQAIVVAFAVVTLLAANSQAVGDEPESTKEGSVQAKARQATVGKFLTKHCLECHSKKSSEGEREFESFRLPLQSQQMLITADEIIDQITLKEMPPEDAAQPSDDERLAIIVALRFEIQSARERFSGTGGRTVLRRLSNREYENTLAALFDRRVDTLGLIANFPKDNTSKNLDNIGDKLVTSGFHLDQYFQAANRLVETRLGKPKVPAQTWRFTDNFVQYEELSGSHKAVFGYKFLCLYEQPNTDTRQGGYGHIEDFLAGVPVSGLYDIQIHAQAMHRDTHYDPKIFRIDFSEPFRIAVVPGDAKKGHIHYPQAIEPILASAIVPDDDAEWLKFRVWLEAGQTPRFIFPNGPYESRASVIEVNKRYKDEFKGKGYKAGVSRAHILRHGALPHIRIGEIKIHGPIAEPHGGKEELAVFGVDGFQSDHALEQLYDFGRRAMRRPLTESDRSRISAMYQKRLAQDASPRQAALDTLKFILCSPSFLFLSEITDASESTLGPFDLASRLSYALWACPPDEELFKLAVSGDLLRTSVLKQQIQRMLADDRSQEFVNGFLDSWLSLRNIGNQPPSRRKNRDYYAENLPASMKQEARKFFRHLLDTDGMVTDFIDADYAFVDKKLAKLYGLPEQKTLRLNDGFQRVKLANREQRGGLLGMAGVLTVSANGVETSPVTRGVWVSENLLGVTPPPPPDVVPAIDANVSGARTIREKLARHSEDKTCSSCHRKIDPYGYALESFDPIGRWRTRYEIPNGKNGRPKIDASGKLPSGETYNNFGDFKKVLSDHRRDQFAKHLSETLLSYTTGRRMQATDQFEISDMMKRVKASNYGLRSLLNEVLVSEIFRSP